MTRLKQKNIIYTALIWLLFIGLSFGISHIHFDIKNEKENLLFIILGGLLGLSMFFYLIMSLINSRIKGYRYYMCFNFIFVLLLVCDYWYSGINYNFISLILIILLIGMIQFYIVKEMRLLILSNKLFIFNGICFTAILVFWIIQIPIGATIVCLLYLCFQNYIFYKLFKNKYKKHFKKSLFLQSSSFLFLAIISFYGILGRESDFFIHILILVFNGMIFSFFIYDLKKAQVLFFEQEKLMEDLVVMSNKLYLTNREKENLQTSILLNQIRPHFLYNILNTISALCSIDSEKAEQMTVSFGKYLRSNMSNLNQQEIISFENEIEHVKNYINLELIRFNAIEDKIEVIYDLRVTNFYLPPLTIQPLVENAIKHGIREKEGKGVLKISSYIEDNFYCIRIEDNGIGFEPEKHYSDKSIGLENIRKRLQSVVKGSLEIQSKIGFGTKTTVKIIKDRLY